MLVVYNFKIELHLMEHQRAQIINVTTNIKLLIFIIPGVFRENKLRITNIWKCFEDCIFLYHGIMRVFPTFYDSFTKTGFSRLVCNKEKKNRNKIGHTITRQRTVIFKILINNIYESVCFKHLVHNNIYI